MRQANSSEISATWTDPYGITRPLEVHTVFASEPDIPDPLLEQFEELERAVRRREHLAKQVTCAHQTVNVLRELSGRSWSICADCGKQLTD